MGGATNSGVIHASFAVVEVEAVFAVELLCAVLVGLDAFGGSGCH